MAHQKSSEAASNTLPDVNYGLLMPLLSPLLSPSFGGLLLVPCHVQYDGAITTVSTVIRPLIVSVMSCMIMIMIVSFLLSSLS